MEHCSLKLQENSLAEDQLGFFRWGRIAGKMLVTNDAGEWALLSESDFDDLLAGRITQGNPLFSELQRKGFLRDRLDIDGLAKRIARRNGHIRRGPHLHVLRIVGTGLSGELVSPALMSTDTADRILDFVLQSMAPALSFDFEGDGGEPLANFPVLQHFVTSLRERNQRGAGKKLRFRVFSNLSAMTESIADWLAQNEIAVCTELNGPVELHDQLQKRRGGSDHATVVRWLDRLRSSSSGAEASEPIQAYPAITRELLDAERPLLDEYVARGLTSIQLLPSGAAFSAAVTGEESGYSLPEFVRFYRRALDYVVELNRGGHRIVERTAAMIARKIFGTDDPGIVDVQSPSGEGTNCLVYEADGRIFPSEFGRRAAVGGDPIFELGQVPEVTVTDVLRHPTVRAIAAASLLDTQPMSAECWNKPFCGFSPTLNYLTRGDLFGQRPNCVQCQFQISVSEKIFETVADPNGSEATGIFRGWATDPIPSVGDTRAWILPS